MYKIFLFFFVALNTQHNIKKSLGKIDIENLKENLRKQMSQLDQSLEKENSKTDDQEKDDDISDFFSRLKNKSKNIDNDEQSNVDDQEDQNNQNINQENTQVESDEQDNFEIQNNQTILNQNFDQKDQQQKQQSQEVNIIPQGSQIIDDQNLNDDDILDVPTNEIQQQNQEQNSNQNKQNEESDEWEDFSKNTKKLHEVTSNIHDRIENLNDNNSLSIQEYTNLRRKLSQASQIYKQKYPNCLPIPMELIDEEEQINQTQQMEECKYGYHLGYNYVLNWLYIITPLQLEITEAWQKIKQTAGHAFDAFMQQEERQRAITFKLNGRCFANGMKNCFKRNYSKILKGDTVDQMQNPRNNLKIEIEQMRNLYSKVKELLQQQILIKII